MRLDLNNALLTCQIMTKAAPVPIFGTHHKTTFHRIPMNITQLLYLLAFSPNVEIVIPFLPEASVTM
jgi:hypothetical protein